MPGRMISVLVAITFFTSLTAAGAQAATIAQPTIAMPSPQGPPISWSNKRTAETESGRVDLPYAFAPGVIKVFHQPGVDVRAALNGLGLHGAVTHAVPGPYDEFELKAGFDRSFWLSVPVGEEKRTVQMLAPMRDKFWFVGLKWDDPGQLGLAPNDPKYADGSHHHSLALSTTLGNSRIAIDIDRGYHR